MRALIEVDMQKPVGPSGEKLLDGLIDHAIKTGCAASRFTTDERVIVTVFPMAEVNAAVREGITDRAAVLDGSGRV